VSDTGQHQYEDGIVLEIPPRRQPPSALARLLATVVADHPGEWARIRHYTEPRSAYAAARNIRNKPRWSAETRSSSPRKGAWLYVRFDAVDNQQGIHRSSTGKSTEEQPLSTRSPQAIHGLITTVSFAEEGTE